MQTPGIKRHKNKYHKGRKSNKATFAYAKSFNYRREANLPTPNSPLAEGARYASSKGLGRLKIHSHTMWPKLKNRRLGRVQRIPRDEAAKTLEEGEVPSIIDTGWVARRLTLLIDTSPDLKAFPLVLFCRRRCCCYRCC